MDIWIPTGQHGPRFHHEEAHPEMPHTMNFRLMLSNHGNPAKAKTTTKEDSSQMQRISPIMPSNNNKLINS